MENLNNKEMRCVIHKTVYLKVIVEKQCNE